MQSLKLILITGLLTLINACGGGGGGGGSADLSLPADSIEITTSNANGVATSAVSSYQSTSLILAVDSSLPSPLTAINTLTKFIFNKEERNNSLITGITTTDPCPVSGTVTDNYSSNSTSASGSFSFNQCDFGSIKINGSVSYSSTWNDTTGAYTDTGNGSVTVTAGLDSFTMAMDFSETGNESSGDYSVTVTYSITGSDIGGYLVTTSQPLVGLNFNDISSGQIIVTGANNTRLRITITSTTTADVELDNGDGTFVFLNQISI